MPSIPLPGSVADLRVRVARSISFIETVRSDSATQLGRAQSAGDSVTETFYVGRVQGFNLALSELRTLFGDEVQL